LLSAFHQLETNPSRYFSAIGHWIVLTVQKASLIFENHEKKKIVRSRTVKSNLGPWAFNSALCQRHDFIQHACFGTAKRPVDHLVLPMAEITENDLALMVWIHKVSAERSQKQ